MSAARGVTVVGGGVVGLTAALRLAETGRPVRVLTADRLDATTSAVAAAIWSPYRVGPEGPVTRWGEVSYEVFAALAAAGVPGVRMRRGRSVLRDAEVPAWVASVPGATVREVAGGREAVAVVPVVDMSAYLPWLADRCAAAGVQVQTRRVETLADVPDDGDVVLAAGLRSGPLAADPSPFPVRGQVVRLADPGLTEWVLDEADPAGLTYVVPRGADVVCGGTDDEGDWSTEVDPRTEQRILDRCLALVPALHGAPILSRAVGLRPGRPTVRLERVDLDGRSVVCCYGHGGAGVTLSWGCASDVLALVSAAG